MRRFTLAIAATMLSCGSPGRPEANGTTGLTAPGDGDGDRDGDGDGDGSATMASAATLDPDDADPDGSEGPSSADADPPVTFDLGMIPDAPGQAGCVQDVDIVFVMDVSTSMGGLLATLADEILVVDAALAGFDLPNPPHYGLAVFVDDAALLNAGAPYADAMALRADFQQWSAFTASNQQVGGGNSNATWTENSLDALWLAAVGFQWRPESSTLRLVIHTTDDTFWDGPTVGNSVMIEHGYAETVMALQDSQVRVYSFADDIGTSCNCADVSMGWFTPYMGMTPIPEATDGGAANIQMILSGAVSLADAIFASVEESYCDPYDPVG